MKTECAVLDIFITTICNLKCKLCFNCIPYSKTHDNFPLSSIIADVDRIFEILDYCKTFCYMGGEILCHPQLPELTRYVSKYANKMGKYRIVTNGVLPINNDLLQALKELQKSVNIEILVSDYGILSKSMNSIMETCNKNNIPLRVDNYSGEDQYFGGWVDLGNFDNRNYTSAELQDLWSNCSEIIHGYVNVYQGKVVGCSRIIGGVISDKAEFPAYTLDLSDKNTSIEEGRKYLNCLAKYSKHGCACCNGYVSQTATRYPAAEQLL